MNKCEECKNKGECTNKDIVNIKKIIGVMSGKGGVGKSTIATLIAKGLNKKGFKVGIVDADITGPSIPRMLNLSDKKAHVTNEKIIPVTTEDGIKVISMNLLLDNESDPVIWRGPLISNMVNQFFTDVNWGELDCLVIDMPPGTGDVALTIMQTLPIDGMIMVTVPQDFVSMIVSKSINMVEKMEKRVIGIVENMSYIKCPKCNEVIKMKESDINKYLSSGEVEILENFPMNTNMNNLSEQGFENLDNEIKEKVDNLIKQITVKCDMGIIN
ncbi:MAG: sodium:proton antiporter [Clostridiales bacterium GWD2_32_19]|nr:MAG: sodium:proton antiporter [Clostridiales bacterium GWD2_32_19]